MSTPTTDRGAIEQIIRALRAAGWELDSVDDGDGELQKVATEPAAIEAIMAVDCAHLYVRRAGIVGWVFFVLGNDPEEVANDYTVTLSDAIDPLTDTWF